MFFFKCKLANNFQILVIKMKKISLISSLFIIAFSMVTFAYANDDDLFDAKVDKLRLVSEVSEGWYDARLITFGTQVYLTDGAAYKLYKESDDSTGVILYKQSPQLGVTSRSQGIFQASASSAASVDTSIRTPIARKNEKKGTHIQYDKSNVKQKRKDFSVDAQNDKGTANYDGGHLVDHKFSAQGSHTDSSNYVPQHHYYNRWLKEHLVKSVSGYLEIPLYTPNPPLIKVLGEDRYDRIPIGILLVTLGNSSVTNMYYFPNNQYNYRTLEAKAKITKKKAGIIASYFKLMPQFHNLLWPAIIYDIKRRDANLARQLTQETKGTKTMESLVAGMAVLSLDEEGEEEAMSVLASNVFHQSTVSLSNILCIDEDQIELMKLGQANQDALNQAFNVFGQFAVEYAIKNSLKSEILSTHSRIMFANIITDFIECYEQVTEEAMGQIDNTFSDVYMPTLNKLLDIKSRMNLRDLIYFANLYEKLSSPFIHDALHQGYKVFGEMDIFDNLFIFFDVLEVLFEKTFFEKPDREQMQNLIDLFIQAQSHLDYAVETGFPAEEFEEQHKFLKESKKRVKQWNLVTNSTSGTYQTSPNSMRSFRSAQGYHELRIGSLGADRSAKYPN